MFNFLQVLVTTIFFSLLLGACSDPDQQQEESIAAPPEAAQNPDREETQEEINRRLRAERRTDPLLQFEPLYDPRYVDADDATHLEGSDRVFGVVLNGIAKAYPTEYVAWHHIIQDDFGSTQVLVSWCALCGTGAAYLNDINGQPGTFSIVGSIGSNVQLGDELTGNAIQQATGEFVEGPLEGQKMERVTAVHATWNEWRSEYPETLLMLPAPGREEAYAHYKPMLGTADERFRGSVREDSRRPRHDLVVGLDTGDGYKAYPLEELARQTLVNDQVGTSSVLVTFAPETETARAFSREVEGRPLTFRHTGGGRLIDEETSSTWSAAGLALSGPMEGTQLEILSPLPSFWFSWAQFYPETEVFKARQ